jgi:hypothetical protein
MSYDWEMEISILPNTDPIKNFIKVGKLIKPYCVQVGKPKKNKGVLYKNLYKNMDVLDKKYIFHSREFKLKMRNPRYCIGYMKGHMETHPENTLATEAFLRVVIEDYQHGINQSKKRLDFIKKMLADIVQETDPKFAFNGIPGDSKICSSSFEYYHNPYFFCVMPEAGRVKGTETDSFDFLRNKKLLSRLNGYRKLLPEDELLSILKKNSEKLLKGENGAGVFKRNWYELFYSWRNWSEPRYFVREELRRRGAKIGIDLPEKYHYLLNPAEHYDELLNIFHNGLSESKIDLIDRHELLESMGSVRRREALMRYKELVKEDIKENGEPRTPWHMFRFLIKELAETKKMDAAKAEKMLKQHSQMKISHETKVKTVMEGLKAIK